MTKPIKVNSLDHCKLELMNDDALSDKMVLSIAVYGIVLL